MVEFEHILFECRHHAHIRCTYVIISISKSISL